MAKRQIFNRKRSSIRKSTDSIGSGLLDPDTNVEDEEPTFWWNNLQENTFPRRSSVYGRNETARQLSVNSQISSSQDSSRWWKNLEDSNSAHTVSTNPRHNLSAAMVKVNVLQTSTSESEEELDLKKRKVRLKATSNRKSSHNVFSNALNDNLDDNSVTTSSRLQEKRVNNLDVETLRKELQEDEEDNSSSTGNILKSKPSISRRRENNSAKDQNPFQDILMEDDVSKGSTTRKSIALKKESLDNNLVTTPSKLREKQVNFEFRRDLDVETSQEDEEDNSSSTGNILKSKPSISQRRKNNSAKDQNPFQDILTEDDVSKGNTTIRKSIALEKESSKRSMQRNTDASKDRTDNQRKSMRASQATSLENIESDLHSLIPNVENTMLENNAREIVQSSDESDIKHNTYLKHKSRFMQRARKSSGRNAFADVLADDNNTNFSIAGPSKENNTHESSSPLRSSFNLSKKSITIPVTRTDIQNSPIQKSPRSSLNVAKKQSLDVPMRAKDNIETNSSSSSLDDNELRKKKSAFLKLKTTVSKTLRNSTTMNPYKEIFEEDGNISARKSNISTEDNRASFKQNEIRISQGSSATEKSSQSERNKISVEGSSDISLTVSSVAEDVFSEKNELSKNDDLMNASKSISRKSVIAKTPEKEIIPTRKSVRKETLKGYASTNEIITQDMNDDSRDDTESQEENLFEQMSKLDSSKATRLTRSLKNRSETPKSTNIGVHEVIHSHNDADREHDSSTSKRSKSSPSKEARLTHSSSRNRFETSKSEGENMELSKRSDSDKTARLTRNNFRNQSETPKSTNIGVHEVIHNSHNDADREHDSSTPKRLSKSSSSKETRLTHSSSRNRFETSKSESKNIELSRNRIVECEEDDNVNVDSEINGTNKVITQDMNDDSRDHTNSEEDLNLFERMSKSDSSKTTRLTRSLKNWSETPKSTNIGVHEVIHSHNDADREHNSSTPKRSSKSSPSKEARLTHNSSRNRFETSKPEGKNMELSKRSRNKVVDSEEDDNVNVDSEINGTNKVITQDMNDDSRDHTNSEEDLNLFERMSKLDSSKTTRLTRSLKNRSGTPKSTNIGVHEVIHSHNDADREHDSSTPKRSSKSSPSKEARLTHSSSRNLFETSKPEGKNMELSKRSDSDKTARLTRNSLKNRSETPKSTNIGVHEVIHSHNDADREHDSSTPKRLSKSSPRARLTHSSSRNRFETSKPEGKNMELSKRSRNKVVDSEEDDNVSVDSEANGVSQVITSTRISEVSTNVGTRKSTVLSNEMEATDDENADPKMRTIQRSFTSTIAEIGNKTNRQSSNRTSIKEGREAADRPKSLSNKSPNYRSTSIKASNKDISFNASKLNSSKPLRKIDDFFKVKEASTSMDKQSSERARQSEVFDTEKMEKIKIELERIKKNREMAAMKLVANEKEKSILKTKNVKSVTIKQPMKKKPLTKPRKEVDKAFLVNGTVYRAPTLPRPKHWVTDRLYKFLWKRMEPKYKLATRLRSEKFIQQLAKIVSLIEGRKNYNNYKSEMEALMKEMARLELIRTRNDFYHFCQDFLPSEFRVKVVPMLFPGNKMNIPYDSEKLHIPLLEPNV